jgi:hypothetical protein
MQHINLVHSDDMHSPVTSLGAACCFAVLSKASPTQDVLRRPFTGTEAVRRLEAPIRVPGTNNATYGPVPKIDQLFQIEFLELAPLPFQVSKCRD